MIEDRRLLYIRIIGMGTFILQVFAAYFIAARAIEFQVSLISNWVVLFGLMVCGVVIILITLLDTWSARWPQHLERFEAVVKVLGRLRAFNLILFGLLVVGYTYLVFGPLGGITEKLAMRLSIFWPLVLIGAILLKAIFPIRTWLEILMTSWLTSAWGFKIASFASDVSTYPFSLSWSEGSRYYYASQFFSKQIYGVGLSLSRFLPGRYIMQSIPFLIPGSPLWFHRLWQVILWIALPLLTAYLISWRLKPNSLNLPIPRFLFVFWVFLILFQVSVYYYLLVSVVIILWGFDSRHFWRSLIVVVLASIWAGICRINWFPMPGLLAVVLFLLERTPDLNGFSGMRKLRQMALYLFWPTIWLFGGVIVAFSAQSIYILISRVEPVQFTSMLTSALLWYRLLPNATYSTGVLLGIFIVSTPLLVLAFAGLRAIHPLRWLGMGTILVVLFVGGLIVSVKIGSGGDLHNLDAFLIILLVIASYVFWGKVSASPSEIGYQGYNPFIISKVVSSLDGNNGNNKKNMKFVQPMRILLVSSALLFPVLSAVNSGDRFVMMQQAQADEGLNRLGKIVHRAIDQGGSVLFISQRHLLTFNLLDDIPIVENYEKLSLMEMAISGNQAYLEKFWSDIRNQRFDLIVSDPVWEVIKGSEYSFGEENDAWVSQVNKVLREYYQREALMKNYDIEVLAPKR